MTQAQPLIQTLPMTLGAPMSDDPSNPTAIEIPLQIELPNGQTLFAAVALGGLPFDGQRQIAERITAAWNAFTGVTTEEIKAPVKCLLQITEPAPTESVLIDGTDYVVHAEVAAELLRLHIELQTAPQAVQATEEMRVCNSEECGWIGPLSETYGYKHSPATLCPECKETTELSAPAHPAEGVPAQAFKTKVFQALGIGSACDEHVVFVNIENLSRRADCLSAIEREFFMVETPPDESEGDTEPGEECLLNWGHTPTQYVQQFAKALAATQPAAQGLDAQDASVLQHLLSNAKLKEWDGGYRADFDISIDADSNGVRAKTAKEAVLNALAAQAKQGGA